MQITKYNGLIQNFLWEFNKTKSNIKKDLKIIVFKWCPGADLNHRHEDFQSSALPLSYKENQ